MKLRIFTRAISILHSSEREMVRQKNIREEALARTQNFISDSKQKSTVQNGINEIRNSIRNK